MENGNCVGKLTVLQKLNEYEFGVEMWLMNDAPTRNRWTFKNLEDYYKTFSGQPILCAYKFNGEIGDGHNMEIRRDPNTGEAYYSFVGGQAERIVGTISDDPDDIWITNEGDTKWIVAKGKIFAFYAKELVDKIIETGTMDVSVETEVADSYKGDDGWEFMTAWTGLAVTILGDGVAPAIPGANIAALAAMQEEFTELKLRAASLREGAKDDPEKKNNSDKGVNKKMIPFNKTQIAALADKFTGWIVVCAAKMDNGACLVGLRNDGWEFGRYIMNSETETFAPERVEKIAVNADFGDGLCTDVSDIVSGLNAEIAANAVVLETTTTQLNDANETIRTLRENESARRVEDAHRMATDTLAAFNANREEQIDVAVLDAVNADIDNGVYTNSVDKDGKWIGGAEVAKTVKALCADAVLAQDRANADRNRRSFIWEDGQGNNDGANDDGSLTAMLRRLHIDE